MGLAILLVVGVVTGWLASIMVRAEDKRGILFNVGAGIVGALAAGILFNRGSILLGISVTTLLASFVSAAGVLAVANFLRRNSLS